MKLKYMLRGLGIGIVVTAAVMGAYTRSAVADARVAVLNEYGIGQEPTLVENEDETQSTSTQSETETQETIPIIVRDEEKESEIESVIESAKAAEKSETQDTEETVTSTEDESRSDNEDEIKEDKSEDESLAKNEKSSVSVPDYIDASDVVDVPENIEISIVGGDDSGTVSRKLYNAGIVDSASEFDAFLMQHGYDKKISVGTKTININDTWQDIAEKLTSK